MGKTAYLFSGQGSTYPGMGKELFDNFSSVRRVFECGGDILGMDIAKLCFEGEESQLAQTLVAQPAIFTVSLAALAAVSETMPMAQAVAGHSLGEYAALTACGVISMEEGFRLIQLRAKAMDKAARAAEGAMFAIIGLTPEEVEQTCAGIEGFVQPANYNSPVQTVISGDLEAATLAADKFTAMGARAVRLNVSSAFHTPMMQPAADEFLQTAGQITVSTPTADFYSNLSGAKKDDFTKLEEYLAKHIVSPVRFTDEIRAMQADGCVQFIELGPKKVLTGLVKKTDKSLSAANVEDLKTLSALQK